MQTGILWLTISFLFVASSVSLGIPNDPEHRSEIDDAREWAIQFGDVPSSDVISRMVQRSKAADADAETLYFVAKLALRGEATGQPVDPIALLRRAVDLGSVDAKAALGYELCTGSLVSLDSKAGLELLRDGERAGNRQALESLGILFHAGAPGIPKDAKKAEAYLKQALEKGNLHAAHNLAALFDDQGDRKLLEAIEAAAELGDTELMQILVEKLRLHIGDVKARRYLLRGALWGNAQLIRVYAIALDSGELGLKRDPYISIRLLTQCARRGDGTAEVAMAVIRVRNNLNRAYGMRILERVVHGPPGPARPLALYGLGEILFDGKTTSPDPARAIELIRQSSAEGFAPARAWLDQHRSVDAGVQAQPRGEAKTYSGEVERELEDANEFEVWFKEAGERPSPGACRRMVARASGRELDVIALICAARAYQQGWGREIREGECARWLELANESKRPQGRAEFADALFHGWGGIPQDAQKGLAAMKELVAENEPIGFFELGNAYRVGAPGVEKDLPKAAPLLEKALELGYARAAGMLYEVHQRQGDSKRGGDYVTHAIQFGDLSVLPVVATMAYADPEKVPLPEWSWEHIIVNGTLLGDPKITRMMGLLVKDDPPLTRMLLRRAARLGDEIAMTRIAMSKITGEYGTEVDLEWGLADLEELAGPHHFATEAQWELGRILCQGLKIPPDTGRGRRLIEMAAKKGCAPAKQWLREHGPSSQIIQGM